MIARDRSKRQLTVTVDFRSVMEKVSGKNLDRFFKQWIFTKGYPELKWDWTYEKGKVFLNLEQTQEHHIFDFPLEVEINENGKSAISTVQMNGKSSTFEIEVSSKPSSMQLDPNLWLLFREHKK